MSAVLRLLKNGTYMMLTVSVIFQSYILQYVIQMPKYMELQFNVSASTANLLTGKILRPHHSLRELSFFMGRWGRLSVMAGRQFFLVPHLHM